MKKALSVLLIIAAIFGFYGGAVNLKDVLDCKAYWEEEGRKTDENLNKLEDGINQLSENETAYLDGKDQIADAEVALANGEAQLAEGKKSYSDLQTLISGLKTARKHGVSSTKEHDVYWHDAFSKALKPNREKMEFLLLADSMQGTLGLVDQLNGNEPGTIASRFSNKGQSYAKFDKAVVQTSKDFKNAANVLRNYEKALFNFITLSNNLQEKYIAWKMAGETLTDPTYIDFATAKATFEQTAKGFCDKENGYGNLNAALPGIAGDLGTTVEQLFSLLENVASVDAMNTNQTSPYPVAFAIGAKLEEYKPTVSALFANYINMLDKENKKDVTKAGYSQQFTEWDKGYQKLSHSKDGEVSKKYPEDLADTSSGVPYAFKNMLSNSTIKSAVKKYDKSLLKVLKKYSGDRLTNDSMEKFDDDIVYLSEKIIPRALKVLAHVKSDANKQLAAGKSELAAGYQQYEDGKAQLAEYEDGEQQVRDGLATLFNTEPNGGLKSIADRIGGDGNFDDLNGHLKLDEGLDGVTEGRNYSADSGVLITKEVLTRGIGTACGLAAALFALIAAILCFAKKHKGAGVFAVLTGLCGIAGIVVAKSAGTEFSGLAGSPLSPVPYIAFAILAVVALAAAIVNFGAKKEA